MAIVMEMLSNEVLMQVFEYFDAYHLFNAFFDLNSRFNRLLTDYRLNLKFNSKHIRNNNIINVKIWLVMLNYLTAVTLINDKHIRMLMSISKEYDFKYLQSMTLRQVRISKQKSSVVKYISMCKSLINLRVQAIDEINDLILMVICCNELPKLKSFECTNSEYSTSVMYTWPKQTNIEYLTVESILYCFSNLLLQTPKLKYLNIDLTNFEPEDSIPTNPPLPIMMNLKELKMKIHFISYIQLFEIMKSMPYLENLELSGSSLGKNLDNGYQLKQLFGHLQEVMLESLECLTSASSVDTILSTFNNDVDGFWSDVTCSIKYDRVYLSAFGYGKQK